MQGQDLGKMFKERLYPPTSSNNNSNSKEADI
jgi:hypothetical protein